MRIEILQLNGDGTIGRAVVDTVGRQDALRWEQLVQDAHLDLPPPYQAEPGRPVYHIQAGARIAQVTERNLVGPLRELVTACSPKAHKESDSRAVVSKNPEGRLRPCLPA